MKIDITDFPRYCTGTENEQDVFRKLWKFFHMQGPDSSILLELGTEYAKRFHWLQQHQKHPGKVSDVETVLLYSSLQWLTGRCCKAKLSKTYEQYMVDDIMWKWYYYYASLLSATTSTTYMMPNAGATGHMRYM